MSYRKQDFFIIIIIELLWLFYSYDWMYMYRSLGNFSVKYINTIQRYAALNYPGKFGHKK
jgi:hypothetical protein